MSRVVPGLLGIFGPETLVVMFVGHPEMSWVASGLLGTWDFDSVVYPRIS